MVVDCHWCQKHMISFNLLCCWTCLLFCLVQQMALFWMIISYDCFLSLMNSDNLLCQNRWLSRHPCNARRSAVKGQLNPADFTRWLLNGSGNVLLCRVFQYYLPNWCLAAAVKVMVPLVLTTCVSVALISELRAVFQSTCPSGQGYSLKHFDTVQNRNAGKPTLVLAVKDIRHWSRLRSLPRNLQYVENLLNT